MLHPVDHGYYDDWSSWSSYVEPGESNIWHKYRSKRCRNKWSLNDANIECDPELEHEEFINYEWTEYCKPKLDGAPNSEGYYTKLFQLCDGKFSTYGYFRKT